MPGFARWMFALVLPLALSGCSMEKKFPYRIDVVLDVDGQELKGSTVQNLKVFNTSDANGKPTRNTSTEGVPVVIELAGRGWLVAAAAGDWNEWKRRKEVYNLTCGEPRVLSAIVPDAGGRNGAPDTVARQLPWWNMPAFVWFPAGRSYKDAVQLCPEEFSSVIGPDVKLVSASIMELAAAPPVDRTLTIKAPWLDEMRADKDNGRRSRSAGEAYVYKPYLGNFEQ